MLIAVLFAGSAATISAEAYKVLVNHKGDWICVDNDSVDAHENHGDSTYWESCDVE
jgi:hypothetical protein